MARSGYSPSSFFSIPVVSDRPWSDAGNTIVVSPELPAPQVIPEPGQVADELYAALAPIHMDDAARGYPLRTFCEALTLGLEEVATLSRDSDEGPGWSGLLDVDRAPDVALGWLGQLVGVRVSRGAEPDVQRGQIRNAAGFRRGTLQAMADSARARLTGQKRVLIRERDGGAYQLIVITYAPETPNPAAVAAALLAQKPAGIVMTYLVQAGQDYDTLAQRFATFDDVEAAYASFDDVRQDLPV